jgi:hypothetical protein
MNSKNVCWLAKHEQILHEKEHIQNGKIHRAIILMDCYKRDYNISKIPLTMTIYVQERNYLHLAGGGGVLGRTALPKIMTYSRT